MQPALVIVQIDVAIEFNRVKREVDALHVAPIEVILNLGIGQKNILDANADLNFGDVFDLLLGLLPITGFAFAEFFDELAKQFERFGVVWLLTQAALRKRDDVAVGNHPFGVVVERVVVPIGFSAELDSGFEFVWHTGALVLIALLPIGHCEEVMGVSL